jgi:hypothetical protein
MIKNIKNLLQKDKDILFAYLYGSYAAGNTHIESDIDIAVYLKEKDTTFYLKKDNEFLSNNRFDIRILNVMPLVLKFKVLKEGKLLFSNDEQKRIDFETEVIDRYFELKPYIDEYYELLKERILSE